MRSVLASIACVLLVSTSAVAQPAAPAAASGATQLQGSFAERLARSVTFELSTADLSDHVLNSDGEFVPNPDEAIRRVGLSIKGSAFFLSPADLSAAYAALPALQRVRKGTLTDEIRHIPREHLYNYFVRAQGSDWLKRAVSGVSLNVSALERPYAVVDDSGREASDRTRWGVDVTFTPAALFVKPADKTMAFTALASYLKAFPDRDKSPVLPGCPSSAVDATCYDTLAGLSGASRFARLRWLTSLLPTVKFESVDAFDYAAYGGRLILFPEDRGDSALTTWVLTWNLAGVIPASQARRDAIAALKARGDLEKVIAALARPAPRILTTTLSLKLDSAVAVPLEADTDGLTWAPDAQIPWGVPSLRLSPDGLLFGYARCPAGVVPCQLTIAVAPTDNAGRQGKGTILVTIDR